MGLLVIIISSTDCIFVSLSIHLRTHLDILNRDFRKIGLVKYFGNKIKCLYYYKKLNTFFHSIIFLGANCKNSKNYQHPFYSNCLSENIAIGQLKKCIKRHIEIIENVSKLEKLFSGQMMFQFLLSTLAICFILFQANLVNLIFLLFVHIYIKYYITLIYFQIMQNIYDFERLSAFLGYLLGKMFQIYLFARYGQQITNEVFHN